MSNDQPTSWLTPRFKTGVTPETLCKMMPDRLVGQRQAMEHFYNKFKSKAEELAPRGECSFLIEITDAECGVSSNFDVKLLLEELHALLRSEKFITVKKEMVGEVGLLEMAWKQLPKFSAAQLEAEKRQLSTVPPPGAYQLNQAMLDDLAARYQAFAAANGPPQQQQQYPPYVGQYPGWAWPQGGFYPPDGFSSPNPDAAPE